MNATFPWTTRLLIAVLTFALCGGPELAAAQDAQTAQPTSPSGNETATTPAAQQENPAATAPQQTTTETNTPSADQQPATNVTPATTTQGQPPAGQQPDATPVPAPAPQTANPNAPARPGSMMDPSAGPLQPVPSTTLPNAPSATQQDQTAQPAPAPTAAPTRQRENEPLGTATAESGRTVGGAASRPAGMAIAPAKQRQVRSWLIKLGAIAGAGVAIGTVFALSKGTSSTPPNATSGTQR